MLSTVVVVHYMASTDAVGKAIWSRDLVNDLYLLQCVTLVKRDMKYEINIQLSRHRCNRRTKHVHFMYNIIREIKIIKLQSLVLQTTWPTH